MRPTLFVLALTLAASPARGQQATAASPPAEIITTGTGNVRVTPDRATIQLTVETRARVAADAATENGQRQRAVIDALRRLGLGPDQVSTAAYAVEPAYRYEGRDRTPQQSGYVARNSVRVSVRELDKLGAIIDAALAAGANDVGQIHFQYSRQAEAQLQALDSAVAEARARAAVMARASGGLVGELLELTTEQHGPMPGFRASLATLQLSESRGPTPISAGELTISATVLGRWHFVPDDR